LILAAPPATAGVTIAVSAEVRVDTRDTRQTIAFAPPERATYGDAPLSLTATSSSGLPVTFAVASGPGTLDGATLRITGAGTIQIRALQGGAGTFGPAAVTRAILVAKAPLHVTAEDARRLVGQPNPAFTLRYSGFVAEDTESVILSAPKASSAATAKSPAGSYPITIKGGLAADYTFAPGELGSVIVEGFGGRFEALLVDDSGVACGKLELNISANSLLYTGLLTLATEASPITVRGTLSAGDSSSAQGHWDRNRNGVAYLDLGFEIIGDTLDGSLQSNGGPLLSIGSGTRLFIQATEGKTKLPAPWTGTHTLVLRDPQALNEADSRALPLGSGSASAIIAPTGSMSIKGTLADGTKLTTSVNSDTGGTFRLLAKPYGKRADSFLSGSLTLTENPDQFRFPGRFHVSEESGLLDWVKAESPSKPADKSYHAGFAADVVAILDPWLAPSTKTTTVNGVSIPAGTLAQRLGLIESATATADLALEFGPADSLPISSSFASLPASLTLNSKGAFSVTSPAINSTKFTLAANPATGSFTGSFTLSDVREGSTKPTFRKVTFNGTLRQGPAGSTEVIGFAAFLLPDFTTSAEQPSFELRLAPATP
jgi:hypothetical protein